jgi:alkylhydroperoxidase family enzyme
VAHLPGDVEEVLSRVPDALAAYRYTRENVLESGIVDQRLKELCFRYLAGDPEVSDLAGFEGRERAALEWAHAIAWDSDRADDALWDRLHQLFGDEELVELGCAIGFELGQQHWRRTVGLPVRDHAATS